MHATIQLPIVNAFSWLSYAAALSIAKEDVRGQHTGRAKVGIVVECHSLPEASTQLEQASRGLAIAATCFCDSVGWPVNMTE